MSLPLRRLSEISQPQMLTILQTSKLTGSQRRYPHSMTKFVKRLILKKKTRQPKLTMQIITILQTSYAIRCHSFLSQFKAIVNHTQNQREEIITGYRLSKIR